MLDYLTRRREQEQTAQQEWISHEIHDGACQYTEAAQMMFGTFRREQANVLSGDWSSFDMGIGIEEVEAAQRHPSARRSPPRNDLH